VRLAELSDRIHTAMQRSLLKRSSGLAGLSQLLNSLSHRSVLQRGFAIVRGDAGQMLRSVASACATTAFDIEFADGHVAAEPRAIPMRPAPTKPGGKAGSQGSLF
jgi:exodeoxyribonuclease VII large subunit